VPYAPASDTNCFVLRETCVSSTQLKGLFGKTIAYPNLENQSWRNYSFQKFTQFSQGNNVLDVPASNTNGFPWRGTCGYSTQLNWPTWKKMSLSPPGKT
jgi:hypothetical protein